MFKNKNTFITQFYPAQAILDVEDITSPKKYINLNTTLTLYQINTAL